MKRTVLANGLVIVSHGTMVYRHSTVLNLVIEKLKLKLSENKFGSFKINPYLCITKK